LFRPLFRKTIRESLVCDTMSAPFARWIAGEFSLNARVLRVIPNGANIDLFAPAEDSEKVWLRNELGLPPHRTLFGYVGILAEQRGLETLVRAMADNGRADVALVLVGEGPQRTALERQVSDAALCDRVLFMGPIPYHAVPEVMKTFDYGVDLSCTPLEVAGDPAYATFSQKLAQYLSSGLPVVAWKLEDTEFVALEGLGGLAERGSYESLSEVLRSLADSSDSERLLERDVVRRFAEENLSTQHLTRTRVEWWRDLLEVADQRASEVS